MIPTDYQSWHHCITVDCGITLSASYIQQRLTALNNLSDFRTQQFIRLYGKSHHQQVLGWFQQAQDSLSS
ncbi:MAG: hypothetical protein HRU21_10415 [Pseudomonadales bacterium]|nr:hypothetical protein [Pseudomonadales bacterium]